MAVLALTTGLTSVLLINVSGAADGLLVSNLRRTYVSLYLELAQQTVNDDLQMKLAHTSDNGLAGLFIGVGLEGRVLFCQLSQRNTHLLLTSLGLRLDRNTDNRVRELHRLEDDRVLLITQRIAGGGVLKADARSDIAGIYAVDILTMVSVHLQNTTQTLALILGSIQYGGTSGDGAGVYAEERQTANERVGSDLERQRGERRVIRRRTGILLVGLRVYTLDVRDVGRSRHVFDNSVQQRLYALVAVCGAAEYRNDLVGDTALADCSLNFRNGQLFALEVLHHEVLVQLSNVLPQFVVVLLSLLHHVSRNILVADILAEVIVVNLSAHGDQVDDTLEGILRADRQLNRNSVALQTVLHHVDYVVEVSTHDIHLVYERHTRNLVLVSLMPNGLRLRLYAALCAEYGYGTVQNAQGALYLYGKVNVARGVDDVDTMLRELMSRAGPVAGGSCGGDGDTTLLLLLHPVHGSGTVMGIADLMVYTGVIQNTLGGSGLTGVDVRHDADISGSFQGIFSRHIALLSKRYAETDRLIAVVCERLVRLCHLVGILALLNSTAQIVASVQDLACQTLTHGLFRTSAGVLGDPTQAQGLTTLRANFHRHLVGSAAYTASLNFQGRHDVFHSLGENLQRFTTGLFTNDIESTINNLLRNALLAVEHDRVYQLGDELGIIKRIGQNVSLGDITSSWHFTSLLQKYLIS